MKPVREVAVLIETSREYGRGLLSGVTRFNEAWYFISVFRKHHGVTPGKYRIRGAKKDS